MNSLDALSEAVDLTRIDRKLADKIEAEVDQISSEITRHGYSDVTMDGRTFRMTLKA